MFCHRCARGCMLCSWLHAPLCSCMLVLVVACSCARGCMLVLERSSTPLCSCLFLVLMTAVLMVAWTCNLYTYMRCVRRSFCLHVCVLCDLCARYTVLGARRAMSLQCRWICQECPWAPCSSGPWKKHNSSYYGEDCSG